MAANQQSKKKAGAMKKKKLQKKCQQARRKQKKLQPQKQKKNQSRLARKGKQKQLQSRLARIGKQTAAAKAANNEQPKICSPRLFASKILRQMPKVRMEAKARGLMKTLLTDMYDHVATEVENLSQKSEPSTISCTDVQAALKEAMAKELAKHSAEPASSQSA